MAETKKHHYVPQFLLRGFADDHERLLVVQTDSGRQYLSGVKDVGHENQGHTLYWPNRTPDQTTLEGLMSDIEGAASTAVKDLLTTSVTTVTDEQRETLGFFLALQWVRSRFLLGVVRRKVLAGSLADEAATEDNVRKSIGLINILVSVLEPWAARRAESFDPKDQYCSIYASIAGWSWRLFRPRGDDLVVGDNLVCMSGVAAGHEPLAPEVWARHGVGVGFETCARITTPLAPNLGLVLTPRSLPPARVTTAEFNRATVFNSRAFVAHRPNWSPNRAVDLALADALKTQRMILPIILEAATV